jgi:hypothetical protein
VRDADMGLYGHRRFGNLPFCPMASSLADEDHNWKPGGLTMGAPAQRWYATSEGDAVRRWAAGSWETNKRKKELLTHLEASCTEAACARA